MKDQLQRELEIPDTPKRIVSLVPSQTELLVDLGLEQHIFGITKFCVHPKHLKSTKTIVGGTKQVHFDKIRALAPDIILCNKEENTIDMIAELETIAPVHISDVVSIEDCLELVAMYGAVFDVATKAQLLITKIQKKEVEFKSFVQKSEPTSVAYFIWKDPWMVAAANTFIDAMLKLNAFKNSFKAQQRYPEIDLETLSLKNLDLILLSTEPFPFKKEHVDLLKAKFPETKIRLVDGEMFSWYGSRLLLAFDYFKALHLDLRPPSA